MKQDTEQLRQLAYDYLKDGRLEYERGNTDDSITLTEKAKNTFETIGDKKGCASSLNMLAVLLGATGNGSMAIDQLFQCIEIAQKYGYPIYEMMGYVNIGCEYQVIGAHEKALVYFNLAEEVIRKYHLYQDPNQKERVLGAYINMQDSYMSLKQYDMVEKFLILERPLIENMPDEEWIHFDYDVMESRVNWVLGKKDLVYEKLDYLIKCATEYTAIGNYVQNFTELCQLLIDMQEYDKWKQVIEIMERYSTKANMLDLKLFVNEMWRKWYQTMDDMPSYTKKCMELTDLYNEKIEKDRYDKEAAYDVRVALENNERERKQAKKKSDTDQLTGVFNRYKLGEDLAGFCKKDLQRLCVGILDIDCFKEKNDTYGHLSGDDCLKDIASIIQDVVSKHSGKVYRYGGDEFLVVILNHENEAIKEIADQIRQKLMEKAIPNENSRAGVHVTLSQGYKNGKLSENKDFRTFFDEADKILYRVKRGGRDNYIVEE